jgi:hypothetical protein
MADGEAKSLRDLGEARTDMELFAVAESLMERVRGQQNEAARISRLCRAAQQKCLTEYDRASRALIGRTV